jgi:hypothetical protein
MRHPRFRHRVPSAPVNFFRRLPARTDSMLWSCKWRVQAKPLLPVCQTLVFHSSACKSLDILFFV